MSIASGRLRQRITIQQSTPTQDALGQPVESWSAVVESLPAEVLSVSGGETIRGAQVEAHISTVVTIRYRSGLSPQMRVVYDSRNLNVDKVLDRDGMKRILELHCTEVA